MPAPQRRFINLDRLIALDTETRKVNTVHVPFMLSYYGLYERGVIDVAMDQNMLRDWLNVHMARKYKNWTFCTHNLEFDFNVLLNEYPEIFHKYEIIPKYVKSRLIMIKLYRQTGYRTKDDPGRHELYHKFIDSMNYFNMALSKLGKSLGYEKEPRVDWIGERMPRTQTEWDNMRKYCYRDSEIVYKALEMFAGEVGDNLGATLASTALKYINSRVNLDLYHIAPSDGVNNFLYAGYAGGRTEAFGRGMFEGDLKVYDVNSLYPWSMINIPMPDVKTLTWGRDWDNNEVGMFKIRATMDHDYPILFNRSDKLRFVTAKRQPYEISLTTPEIEYLINQGEEVNILGGYKCQVIPNPFIPVITDIYAHRNDLKRTCTTCQRIVNTDICPVCGRPVGDPREIIFKLLMNSGYGKFGEIIREYDCESIFGLTNKELVEKQELGYEVCGDWIVKGGQDEYTNHTHYLISALITAYSRLKLQSFIDMLRNAGAALMYVDTDSLFTYHTLPSGPELGMLKLEKEPDQLVIFRAKMYGYHALEKNEDTGDKEYAWTLKIKGLPGSYLQNLRRQDIDMYNWLNEHTISGDFTVTYEKMNRFRESIRRGVVPYSVRSDFEKSFDTGSDGKRCYHKELIGGQLFVDNTLSRPFDYTELAHV